MKLAVKARTRKAHLPPTRDPFINAALIPAGISSMGAERFFISSWNLCSGTTCVLVDSDGNDRRFRPGLPHGGFYSAVYTGHETLWLCGTMSEFVRLDIASGKFEVFPTGLPWTLVFAGMPFDPATGQLLVIGRPTGRAAMAIAFDTRRRQIKSTFKDLDPSADYMRSSFPNGDGTCSILSSCGSLHAMLRWNPKEGTLVASKVALPPELQNSQLLRTAEHPTYGRYLPHVGWYDPVADASRPDAPRPCKESAWFGRHGGTILGGESNGTDIEVKAWDLSTGAIRTVCSIPDCLIENLNVTRTGKIIGVNLYGVLTRHDIQTGNLEISRELKASSLGQVDRLRRVDKDRIVGTTYITQRFWEVNLRRRTGTDLGRAAPGPGEILCTWKIGGRIYLACYNLGALTAYDPARPAHYPENPRTVACCTASMRPVAQAEKGKILWYACSRKYGHLGSTLTRYDTATGLASYTLDPLPDLQIRSLCFDDKLNHLVAGTSVQADCDSFPATRTRPSVARLDPVTMQVIAAKEIDREAIESKILGPIDRDRYLVQILPQGKDEPPALAALNAETLVFTATPAIEALQNRVTGEATIHFSGRRGLFLVRDRDHLDLWNARSGGVKPLIVQLKNERLWVEWPDVFLIDGKNLIVLEGLLSAHERSRVGLVGG